MHFFQFMLMLPRNLRPIKQFIYMHLKVYNIFFQKMVWLILFWATVPEILRINISTKCWIRRNLQNYSTIISWTVNHSKINNIIFWKNRMQTFRCKSAKYLYFIKKSYLFWQAIISFQGIWYSEVLKIMFCPSRWEEKNHYCMA